MARRFEEFYRVQPRVNLGDPNFWNGRFSDIDRRLHQSETALADLDSIADRVEGAAFDRINNVITPLVVEARERLTSITTIFEASSETEVEVGQGLKTFTVVEEERPTFAPLSYVMVFTPGDFNVFMAGRTMSYNEDTGEITVDVLRASGAGEHDEWKIAPVVLANDLEELADQVEAWANATNGDRILAQSAAGTAVAKAGEAVDARNAAVSARGGSENARDDAQLWAQNAYGVEVAPGLYSAYHWALVAQANAAPLQTVFGRIGEVTAEEEDYSEFFYTKAEINTALSGKSNTGHSHALGDVVGLSDALDGKVPTGRQVIAGAGLSGGGNLAANRTLSIATDSNGYGSRTVSTGNPSGGANGDIWLKV